MFNHLLTVLSVPLTAEVLTKQQKNFICPHLLS